MIGDAEWVERGIVVSARGRAWTKRATVGLCRNLVRRWWEGVMRADVIAAMETVLADDRWVGFRRGMVPSAFARDAADEALRRVLEKKTLARVG